jgi:hypothetical protein
MQLGKLQKGKIMTKIECDTKNITRCHVYIKKEGRE